MLRSTLALALLALAAPVAAQQTATSTFAARAPSCIDSIPASALTPVPVFLVPALIDGTHRSFLPTIANLLQELGDQGRAMLGATGDSLPHGEPALTWRDVRGRLLVTWHRDGTGSWRVTPDSTIDLSPDAIPATAKAPELLGRALDKSMKDGRAFLLWPDGEASDSVSFGVSFMAPLVDDSNRVHPIRETIAVPMFIVDQPRVHEVRGIHNPKPAYPPGALMGAANGRLIVEFVVDTTGHADMSTLHDVWPSDRPRLAGRLGDLYNAFLQSARSAIERSTYEPGRIGGCKVRQVVEQPFSYSVR